MGSLLLSPASPYSLTPSKKTEGSLQNHKTDHGPLPPPNLQRKETPIPITRFSVYSFFPWSLRFCLWGFSCPSLFLSLLYDPAPCSPFTSHLPSSSHLRERIPQLFHSSLCNDISASRKDPGTASLFLSQPCLIQSSNINKYGSRPFKQKWPPAHQNPIRSDNLTHFHIPIPGTVPSKRAETQ